MTYGTSIDDLIALHVARYRAPRDGRALRERHRLSLREIGYTVGVSPSTVCRWESGERRPRGAAAIRYAALLDRLDRLDRTHEGTTLR
jgi:DNA-binding transcriptional regulator YiaG